MFRALLLGYLAFREARREQTIWDLGDSKRTPEPELTEAATLAIAEDLTTVARRIEALEKKVGIVYRRVKPALRFAVKQGFAHLVHLLLQGTRHVKLGGPIGVFLSLLIDGLWPEGTSG